MVNNESNWLTNVKNELKIREEDSKNESKSQRNFCSTKNKKAPRAYEGLNPALT